jgi:hypothetical protein
MNIHSTLFEAVDVFVTEECFFLGSLFNDILLTAYVDVAANGRMLDWEVFLRSYPCRFKD